MIATSGGLNQQRTGVRTIQTAKRTALAGIPSEHLISVKKNQKLSDCVVVKFKQVMLWLQYIQSFYLQLSVPMSDNYES